MWRTLVLLLGLPLLAGCGFIPLYSYSNDELDPEDTAIPRPVENVYRVLSFRPLRTQTRSAVDKASLAKIPWNIKSACRAETFNPVPGVPLRDHCQDSNFVALSISGGGSRASIFGAAVMFELQRYGLLEHVDLMSCVSGGCLTAAYYALSCDAPGDPATCPPATNGARRYAWQEEEVYPLLQRHLLWRWFGNWFWPTNFLKFWFTHFDRTDIMANTISSNLYDRSLLDNNQFRFRDLNPGRPNLAINATNVVATPVAMGSPGSHDRYDFTFTPEAFQEIHSDLATYPIAKAVMASASFPGAFNYVTLRDFQQQNYIHLMDGGAYDNLGLNPILSAISSLSSHPEIEDRVVIVIDAYKTLDNSMAKMAEVRSWTDYIIDSNFFVAYDTLLTSLRDASLNLAREQLSRKKQTGTLLHISWQGLDRDPDPEIAALGIYLNRIPTSLNISERNASRLRDAAKLLVERKLKEVLCSANHRDDARRIRKLLSPSAPVIPCF